jgi:hypothetical protein
LAREKNNLARLFSYRHFFVSQYAVALRVFAISTTYSMATLRIAGLGKEFCLQSALEGLRFAMCWLTNAQCSPWPGNGEKMRSGLACPHNDNCPWG